MKGKNHMILSTDAKALDKIQHTFTIKALNKVGMERGYFNVIGHTCIAQN